MDQRPPDQRPMDQRATDERSSDPMRMESSPEDMRAARENDLSRRDTTHDDDSMWSGMSDVRRRFDQLQVQFVDQPKEAVAKAEQLMKDAIDRMTGSMNERLQSIHGEIGDGNADTERLRQAMQRLRRMIDSFEHPADHRHAA